MENSIIVWNDAVSKLKNDIKVLGEERSELAYIIGQQLSKIGDEAKKDFSEGFKKYVDNNGKDLPGGFECTVRRGSKTYKFEENGEWMAKKMELEAIESKIKMATDMAEKGGTYVDTGTGEIIDPVTVTWKADSYVITRK